jgi:prefoldin subunit 5
MLNFLKRLLGDRMARQPAGSAAPASRARVSLSERVRALDHQITKLQIEADRLAAEFKRCFDEVQTRQDELQALTVEADHEASQMRRCFSRSQELYAEGDGAGAKALSLKGRTHQHRAEFLNARAQEIRDIGKIGKQKELQCRELNSQIALLVRQKKELESALDLLKSCSGTWTTILDQRLGVLPDHALDFFAKIHQADPDGLELFIRGLANPALDEEMAGALPAALADLLTAHPLAAGLLRPLRNRGPGARSWVGNLANPNADSAAGTAYELLASRRLMHVAAGDLKILPMDELSFGSKQQARYTPDAMKTRDLLAALVAAAGKRWAPVQANESAIERKTVEADLLLYRGGDEISVDFKYSAAGARHLDPAQLLGVAVALATGEISSAHFVCNSSFDKVTRERVDDINRVITKWDSGRIGLHGNYSWRIA